MLSQLGTVRYEINPRGLIEIESKADAAKRGIKSPDRAEALMLAFANRTPGWIEYAERQAKLHNGIQGTEREDSSREERRKAYRLNEVYNVARRSVGDTNFVPLETSDEGDDIAERMIRRYLEQHVCAMCGGDLVQAGGTICCPLGHQWGVKARAA